MNLLLLIAFFITSYTATAQQPDDGYELKVTITPLKNQYIFLGHYSGKTYPLIDSALLNDKGEAVFKGPKKLGGGVYIVVLPNKDRFFEMIIDADQHFSMAADTANLTNVKFHNSPENLAFKQYQDSIYILGTATDSLRKLISAQPADSAKNARLYKAKMDQVKNFRQKFGVKNENKFLGVLMNLMQDTDIPESMKKANGTYDTVAVFQYLKAHYWDGINFWDDRITRTPAALFESRLEKYYTDYVYPSADSVIKEIDWMLGYASVSTEATRVLLVKFFERFYNMKYMWEDAVFVHLFQKYFSQNNYPWLTAQGKKMITDRAYNLMANITGNPASDIELPTRSGSPATLYTTKAKYTVVAFFDPTCGHCKEVLPKLDSMYHSSWKDKGAAMFSVAKETDGKYDDWLKFLDNYKLTDWTNVYYSKEADQSRITNNIPGYSQLFDVQSFPTVYLLDSEKKIIAKKVTADQIEAILQLKEKNK